MPDRYKVVTRKIVYTIDVDGVETQVIKEVDRWASYYQVYDTKTKMIMQAYGSVYKKEMQKVVDRLNTPQANNPNPA